MPFCLGKKWFSMAIDSKYIVEREARLPAQNKGSSLKKRQPFQEQRNSSVLTPRNLLKTKKDAKAGSKTTPTVFEQKKHLQNCKQPSLKPKKRTKQKCFFLHKHTSKKNTPKNTKTQQKPNTFALYIYTRTLLLGCLLVVKYLKAFKRHPLEGPGIKKKKR